MMRRIRERQRPLRRGVTVTIAVAIALVVLIGFERTGSAQAPTRVSLPNTEYWEFTSQVTRRPYAVSIALPDSYNNEGGRRYPVVYVTDSHDGFPLVTHIYRVLRRNNDVPELIIVGISGTNVETWVAVRNLDFTPTRNEALEALISKQVGQPVRSGDAVGFAQVLTRELLPDIERRFRVTDDRTFIGHSLGGLFGAYMLFHAPNTFRRMILVSPSLQWDDSVMFRHEEKYASSSRVLRAEVFFAAGSLENSSMLGNLKRFASTLEQRKHEGLILHSHIFDGETHSSVMAAAFARGLRVLFPKQAAPR